MKKTIIVFSILIFMVLLLFRISRYAVVYGHFKIEFALALIAFIFLLLGIFLYKRSLYSPVIRPNLNKIDYQKIKDLEITSREYDVLQGISKGLSNKEIANKLFLSESTIKTHVSNLFSKLNVKRRTQAMQMARAYQIV